MTWSSLYNAENSIVLYNTRLSTVITDDHRSNVISDTPKPFNSFTTQFSWTSFDTNLPSTPQSTRWHLRLCWYDHNFVVTNICSYKLILPVFIHTCSHVLKRKYRQTLSWQITNCSSSRAGLPTVVNCVVSSNCWYILTYECGWLTAAKWQMTVFR